MLFSFIAPPSLRFPAEKKSNVQRHPTPSTQSSQTTSRDNNPLSPSQSLATPVYTLGKPRDRHPHALSNVPVTAVQVAAWFSAATAAGNRAPIFIARSRGARVVLEATVGHGDNMAVVGDGAGRFLWLLC